MGVNCVRRETRRSLLTLRLLLLLVLLLRSLRLTEPHVSPHRATRGHDLPSFPASVLVPQTTRDFVAWFRVGFLQIRRIGSRVVALVHGPENIVVVSMRRLTTVESRRVLAHRGIQTAPSLHNEGAKRGTSRSCRYACPGGT